MSRSDFFEVDREGALFLRKQVSERIHGILLKPATHAEDHSICCSDKFVDSVVHRCDGRIAPSCEVGDEKGRKTLALSS